MCWDTPITILLILLLPIKLFNIFAAFLHSPIPRKAALTCTSLSPMQTYIPAKFVGMGELMLMEEAALVSFFIVQGKQKRSTAPTQMHEPLHDVISQKWQFRYGKPGFQHIFSITIGFLPAILASFIVVVIGKPGYNLHHQKN